MPQTKDAQRGGVLFARETSGKIDKSRSDAARARETPKRKKKKDKVSGPEVGCASAECIVGNSKPDWKCGCNASSVARG